MTIVRMNVLVPANGADVPAAGSVRWQPTARRVVPSGGSEAAALVLPASFTATLAAGVAEVDVEPSTGVWVWSVVENFVSVPARRRYLAVPDAESVDYTDLVEIDPETLDPEPSADPAWSAPLTELDTRLSAGVITPDPDDPGFFLIGA
jgi:hypothetical protein